jgi:hypothetical protein
LASEFKINFQKNLNYTNINDKPMNIAKAKAHGKFFGLIFKLEIYFNGELIK